MIKKNRIILIILIFIIPIALFLQNRGVLGKAPDFNLNDLNGNRFYLSSRIGKIVVINFWSTHCPPCMEEMPELQKLSKEFAKSPVEFIGICTDPAERGYVEKLINGLGVKYRILIDEKGKVSALYNIKGIPVVYIIDQKGNISSHTVGYHKSYISKYKKHIENLLKISK